MSYLGIDPVLNSWARQRGFVVMKEGGRDQRRAFHTSSEVETFQVVVEPEQDGVVRMDAHLIEGVDDEEAHFTWRVPIARLRPALDLIADSIRRWLERRPA